MIQPMCSARFYTRQEYSEVRTAYVDRTILKVLSGFKYVHPFLKMTQRHVG